MKFNLACLFLLLFSNGATAQNNSFGSSDIISIELNRNWQFSKQSENKWFKAIVPGTIHTDLLANKLIPDPYFRNNESQLQWIDQVNWDYKTIFNIDDKIYKRKYIELVFDGLDTYADVYLNGKLILQADNMFRGWTADIKPFIKRTNNHLLVKFISAQHVVDSIARSRLPLLLPDNNRVYARKAQFQFGWDWGPKFVGCGIWKKVKIESVDRKISLLRNQDPVGKVKLIRQKDSVGTSFYFEKDGKPIYAKGANWIPSDVFIPRLRKDDYRKLLQSVKDANMNMLRVWGGGIYESDDFYDLCDSLGIMVWQDFMFAGGMIPGDDAFFRNVKEEVKYQLQRLKHHPCIVLWCGNNEIDEAWHHWGWQDQFNLHGTDSAAVWNDYKRMFIDSLPKWVNEFEGTRPYISTSPMHGWGNAKSLTEGDSHYWGLWWGLEDWENFENKTGRFVSEYGMQAMPNLNTIKSFTDPSDRYLFSPVIRSHQKATDGFKKINHYLQKYFVDTAKFFQSCRATQSGLTAGSKSSIATLSVLTPGCLESYTYLTQCLQYYILKNSIAVHRNKYPVNMGTLLWQLNDCWPVTSWSITDYSRQPKAAWYAVKEAYRDDLSPRKDAVYPRDLKLRKPTFNIKISGESLSISSDVFAKYIYVSLKKDTAVFSDNYFDLEPGIAKIIVIKYPGKLKSLLSELKIISFYDVSTQ